jgi:hypothetical protein
MSPKDSKDKETHDHCVSIIADELKKNKWAVKANLEGWEKPTKHGGIQPDIEAKKGCLTRICEVVNEETLSMDKAQLAALKDYCEEYDFHVYVVDKDGKRKLIDPQAFGKE